MADEGKTKRMSLATLSDETIMNTPADAHAKVSAGPTGAIKMGAIPKDLQPHLRLAGDTVFGIVKPMVLLGRVADGCDLQIDDKSASRHHASITYTRGEFELHDMGSTNGTLLNGREITRAALRNGDEIRIGDCRMIFCV